MLYTKTKSQSFLGLEKKIFKVFLPYMDMVAILFSGVKPFEQYPFDRRLQVKSGEIGRVVSENKTFKDYMILNM